MLFGLMLKLRRGVVVLVTVMEVVVVGTLVVVVGMKRKGKRVRKMRVRGGIVGQEGWR
jgi:hypothetical protein